MKRMTSVIARYRVLDQHVLVVAVRRVEGAWCAYIGNVPGDNYDEEVQLVKARGSKLPENLAKAMFPEMELPYAL